MPFESCLVAKLSNYMELSDQQKEILVALEKDTVSLAKGKTLKHVNAHLPDLCVVKSGWLIQSRTAANGEVAICQIYLPGDVIGLEHVCVEAVDDHIEATTDVELCPFSKAALRLIFQQDNSLAALFFYVLGRDALISRGLLSSTILHQATPRLAYFLLLIETRLHDLAGVRGKSFELGLTQARVGDAIALSHQQVNRSFRELRERELVNFERGKVTVLNRQSLMDLCAFEPQRYELNISNSLL